MVAKIEAAAKKVHRARTAQMAILITVETAGFLALAAAAPNAVQLLKKSGALARIRYRTKTTLGRLKQKGEIEFVERDGKKYARLTEKGERILALYKEKLRMTEGPRKRWDRRYRLVIFDIPEKRRSTRERVRREVSAAGFLRVQDSAWIYPYDCEEFIALLKAELKIGKDVLYAVIESIENDAWIRRHFNLPVA